jgi:hypothetical protein
VKKSTGPTAKCTPTRALWSSTTSWCWPPAPTPGCRPSGQSAPRVLRLSHHRGSESHPQRRQERQERGGDRGACLASKPPVPSRRWVSRPTWWSLLLC